MIVNEKYDVPYIERRKQIDQLYSANPILNIRLVSWNLSHTSQDVLSIHHDHLKSGYEGSMLKTLFHSYTPGKRSNDWLKWKETNTIDGIVVGLEEGKNRLKNSLGALTVQLENTILVHIGSGLTDELRILWWSNPDLIVNKCVEISYQYKTDGGSLRHPRFYRVKPIIS